MTRKNLYDFIKNNNLEEVVKKQFNDNYTRVSNTNLESVVKAYACNKASTAQKYNVDSLANFFMRLLATLQTKGVLTAEDCAYIGGHNY